MFEIKGTHTSAKFITDDVDYACVGQIQHICNLDVMQDVKIRVMADVCPAIGTTIGSTFTYDGIVLPSLVSGDIGCGILSFRLHMKNFEPQKIQHVIQEQVIERKRIDSIVAKRQHRVNLNELRCKKYIDIERCYASLGTLGGGNHFIEFDRDEDGEYWLTIHSGSRLLGSRIYEYYIDKGDMHNTRIFSSLEGNLARDYIEDCMIARKFAEENQLVIVDILCKFLKADIVEEYHSVHNYIDAEQKIIRKGAISAWKDEKVVIPISASPTYGGVILGRGKGNEEWNYSAPHGAGRICSRSEAKNLFTLNTYKKEMDGVWSECISGSSIDESPMVYKKREVIEQSLAELVEIEKILTPVFNFKSKV